MNFWNSVGIPYEGKNRERQKCDKQKLSVLSFAGKFNTKEN
jgi:hypothetical protein